MTNKTIFYINIVVNIVYIVSLILIMSSLIDYAVVYPDYKNFYLLKIIISAILLGFKAVPYFVLDHNQNIVFHIILWISMLSVLPDVYRCFYIYA